MMNGPICLAPAMPARSRVHSADRRRDTREQALRRRDPPAPRQALGVPVTALLE